MDQINIQNVLSLPFFCGLDKDLPIHVFTFPSIKCEGFF